jgi:hypothetical protein
MLPYPDPQIPNDAGLLLGDGRPEHDIPRQKKTATEAAVILNLLC